MVENKGMYSLADGHSECTEAVLRLGAADPENPARALTEVTEQHPQLERQEHALQRDIWYRLEDMTYKQ